MADRGTVVVVDDSPLLRTIIAETLDSITGIRVIGQAASGREGLHMIEALDPDIVSLDIEMGDLSGIEVLEAVMAESPRKVVMVSSHTEAGADVTLKALGLGAIDFVAKGRLDPGPDGFEARLRRTFTTALHARVVGHSPGRVVAPPVVRPSTPAQPDPRPTTAREAAPTQPGTTIDRSARARRSSAAEGPTPRPAKPATAAERPGAGSSGAGSSGAGSSEAGSSEAGSSGAGSSGAGSRPRPRPGAARPAQAETGRAPTPGRLQRPDFVILASSTGGPPALQRFFETLTMPLPVPMVVVQHMPESFTARLAARLDEAGPNQIREAGDGDQLEPGVVLVAPGGFHLEVVNDRVRLNDSPPVGGLRPRADLTFESAVGTRRGRMLGIVLTGMGDDGLEGGRQLVASGGALIAQDAESCTVDGMPRQVREAGLASETGSPEALAHILQRLTSGRAAAAPERTGVSR